MNFFQLPSVALPPTRPLFSFSFLLSGRVISLPSSLGLGRRSFSPMVTSTRSLKLLRSELSIQSSTMSELQDRPSTLSHLRVSSPKTRPSPPPEPPDPPDWRLVPLLLVAPPSRTLLPLARPPSRVFPSPLASISLVWTAPIVKPLKVSSAVVLCYHLRPYYVTSLLVVGIGPFSDVASNRNPSQPKLLCLLYPPSINGHGLILCSRFGDVFLGRNPVDILRLDLGGKCLIFNPLLWNDPTISSAILSYNPAALYLVISFVAAWSGPVMFQSSEAQNLVSILYLRTVLVLVRKRCSSDMPSFTSRFILIICFSTILLSLANQSFSVLLLAGEGTSGSCIPDFVILHILIRRCKIFGPESSLIHFEAPSDNCVLLPCDLFQGPNAGMFSSPTVWESFNIPPSSVGTERSLPPSSLFRERTFPPCSLSMKEYLPDSLPVNFVNSVTVLFSCVAVRTGPEETTELTLVLMLGGEDWLSKSHDQVTTSRSLGFAVMIPLSQASFVSILLSINLSALILFAFMLYCIVSRGWLIPSVWCKVAV